MGSVGCSIVHQKESQLWGLADSEFKSDVGHLLSYAALATNAPSELQVPLLCRDISYLAVSLKGL